MKFFMALWEPSSDESIVRGTVKDTGKIMAISAIFFVVEVVALISLLFLATAVLALAK